MPGQELTPVPGPASRPVPVPLTAPLPVRMARAARSPSGLVPAGTAAALCVWIGASPVIVVTVAVLIILCRVAVAAIPPRPPRGERILPYSLSDPWRQFVLAAVSLGQRFAAVTSQRDAGAVHDQLLAVGHRIDEGVWWAWDVARKGNALDQALAALDTAPAGRQAAETRAEYERLLAAEGPGSAAAAALARTLAALEAQLATADRLRRVSGDAADKLRLLNAQLGEAVAEAVELALTRSSDVDLTRLSGDVDGAVSELEALRQGLDEAGRAGGGTNPA
jgi:hypothetical protein